MDQYIQFIMANWLLCAAFIVVLALIVAMEFKERVSGAARLTPQELVEKINHEQAVVFDIRNQDAFRKGHILGSIHTSVQDIESKPKKIEKYKTKPVVIACSMGQQSQKLANQLKDSGFEQVFVLGGGVQAWQSAQLPLTAEGK